MPNRSNKQEESNERKRQPMQQDIVRFRWNNSWWTIVAQRKNGKHNLDSSVTHQRNNGSTSTPQQHGIHMPNVLFYLSTILLLIAPNSNKSWTSTLKPHPLCPSRPPGQHKHNTNAPTTCLPDHITRLHQQHAKHPYLHIGTRMQSNTTTQPDQHNLCNKHHHAYTKVNTPTFVQHTYTLPPH